MYVCMQIWSYFSSRICDTVGFLHGEISYYVIFLAWVFSYFRTIRKLRKCQRFHSFATLVCGFSTFRASHRSLLQPLPLVHPLLSIYPSRYLFKFAVQGHKGFYNMLIRRNYLWTRIYYSWGPVSFQVLFQWWSL